MFQTNTIVYVCQAVFGLLTAITLAACDPFNTNIGDEVAYYEAIEKRLYDFPDTLVVMTWNVKFGGGRIDFFFDCYGDRVVMTKPEVMENMARLVDIISELNPDIIFLQEVDVGSKRSADVDQMQYLLDRTPLNYGVYASQWKSRYIPRKGLGHVNSGNAILSKWELSGGQRISLPLIEEQDFITRYFYLKRNLLLAELNHPEGSVVLLTTHASAYAKDNTKLKQLKIVKAYIDSLATENRDFILGGDFNSLPPFSKQNRNFDDSACADSDFEADDYSAEILWMMPFYEDYDSSIPLEEYRKNNRKHFTHTTNKNGFWNRKLDYIFTNRRFVPGSGETYQQWMEESDHAPVIVKYVLCR